LVYDSNRFQSVAGKAFIDTGGTSIKFTDSVFVSSGTTASILVPRAAGEVGFCTFVGDNNPPYPGIDCTYQSATLNLHDNIFAKTSAFGCGTTYSLFSSGGVTGTNVQGDVTTFFTNLTGGDFHLATGSPALHRATPGSSGVDIEGTARPMPASSMADVGAYESPE
jgi:hypothetical protein